MLFFITIGTVHVLLLLLVFFFKHVGKTKYAVLYYYRYLIIMLQTSYILKLINKKLLLN